jgi:hypothetical protein
LYTMRSFIFILLLSGSFSAFSQTYHPFPDSGAVWEVLTGFGPAPIVEYWTTFFLEGDTIYNGLEYNKFYYYEYPNADTILIGGIREDTNRRVYLHMVSNDAIGGIYECLSQNNHLPNEFLLYDFSRSIGDTIIYSDTSSFWDYHQCLDSMEIEYIDSTMVFGKNRSHIYGYARGGGWQGQRSDDWIEGVGSTKGPLGPYMTEFEWGHQLCSFEYQGQLEVLINCSPKSIEETTYLNSVSIHPNPITSSSVLTIEYPNQFQFTMDIVDLQGRVIESRKIGERFSFSEVNLDSGIYLVRIKSNDEVLGTERIVVL